MNITTISNSSGKKKNKSVGQRLKQAKSYQKQEEVLLDWAENWKNDQEDTIYKLRQAAWDDDHGEIMHMIDQLIGMTEKRFTALNNVVKTVSNPDRELEDRREL